MTDVEIEKLPEVKELIQHLKAERQDFYVAHIVEAWRLGYERGMAEADLYGHDWSENE